MLHFTVENGLPTNTVYDIYRDSKGFLWLATDKGIVRFNGIEFEKFTTNDGLPDNEIFFAREDYSGRLWTSCFNGELCFYKDGIFHTAANTPFLKTSTKASFPVKMELEPDSSITITFTNAYAVNIKNDKLKPVLPVDNVEKISYGEELLVANRLSNADFKLYFHNHICIIDSSYQIKWTSKYKNPEGHTFSSSGKQGYFFTINGIYDKNENLLFKFINKNISNSYIYRVGYYNGNWYIGTINGLFINNDIQLLKNDKVSDIMMDSEGNIWISTLNNGVYELNKNYRRTQYYDNIYTGQIKYAHADLNALYFTTSDNNVYRLRKDSCELIFDYFKNFGAYFTIVKKQSYKRAYTSNSIVANNNFFYLDDIFGFTINNIASKKPFIHQYKGTHEYFGRLKEMVEQGDSIYLKTTNSIATISKPDIFSDKTVYVRTTSTHNTEKRALGIAVTKNNILWYSTFTDVYKIVSGNSVVQKQFRDISFKSMHIVGDYLVGISNKNQLVIALNFDKNISISRYNTNIKCIWNTLYKLNDSNFLISTDNQYRILHLYKATDTPRYQVQIIENNSLPVQAEYICSNDSFCYFFKNGSITRIPVMDIFIKHAAPAIFFKTLRTRDTSYPITPGMKIKYEESKDISISFSPFSFGSRYVICEYSISKDTVDHWRQVRNNEINLFEPGYGHYVVKVRAKTLSSDTFSNPFVFSFTISKPFWATWWFIGLITLLFIISVSLIVRAIILQRTRKREAMHKNEIKFLRSEYKALNALMNPHFIFNTLNNVQWLVNNDDKMAANHYLRVFSDLVRQNMYNISKELIPLANEIELVRNYLKLEKLRFKDALNFEININNDVDLDSIKVPPLLIQPLVENAIKHGILPGTNRDNILTINVYPEGGKLYVDILDNGIGINESQKQSRNLHKSTGIENIRNRIQKLSLMHDIHINLSITEIRDPEGKPAGTLASVLIDIQE